MAIIRIIFKNIFRSPIRTLLTSLGTVVLVFVVTLVWSVLSFLDKVTSEKSDNFKAIVTERWQIPSQMPFAYARSLSEGAAREPTDIRPLDSMTWQFYGGSIESDAAKRKPESMVFCFALEPDKLLTMMDDLDTLQKDNPKEAAEFAKLIEEMKSNRQSIILGPERLQKIGKKVGDRITLHGLNYKGIDLEFQIIGMFPPSVPRYQQSGAMNRDYLNAALDDYQRKNKKPHFMAAKTLNLVWLRVPDSKTFEQIADQVLRSPEFAQPAVKCETQSSGISTFLDAYKDLIWGMRFLLAPAILITLSLVIANAISISVRERRLEMAVLKVLGFRPTHLLSIVLGEALLIGVMSGLFSASATFWVVNKMMGGMKFPIAFFPAFFIPVEAVVWGIGIGAATAIFGAVLPAWSARSVRVADVFSKVT